MSPSREATPLIRTLFHCYRGGLNWGGTTVLIICYGNTCSHNPVLIYSFRTCHWILNKNYTMGVTSVHRTVFPSRDQSLPWFLIVLLVVHMLFVFILCILVSNTIFTSDDVRVVERWSWWVSLVEQELLTFSKHMRKLMFFSCGWSIFSVVVCGSLSFCTYSFILWFTVSDYPFGIFKVFLKESTILHNSWIKIKSLLDCNILISIIHYLMNTLNSLHIILIFFFYSNQRQPVIKETICIKSLLILERNYSMKAF